MRLKFSRAGTIAAAYVNGLQAHGVSACIKHFVANDQEHERTAVDSVVSERALREIYLYPYVPHSCPKIRESAHFETSGLCWHRSLQNQVLS